MREARGNGCREAPVVLTRPDIWLPQLRAGGRPRICGHLIIWAGAVRPKGAKTKTKKCDKWTEGLKKLGVVT